MMDIQEKLKLIKEMVENKELIIYNGSDSMDRDCYYIGKNDLCEVYIDDVFNNNKQSVYIGLTR